MFIVDANVLVYAVDTGCAHHAASKDWLARTLSAPGTVVGLPWTSLLAFVRLTTNARVFSEPLSPGEAMGLVQGWLALPGVVTPEPTRRHAALVAGMLVTAGTAGNLTNDAHLAALALEQGATIVTFDRDLERFGVPTLQPIG